jgi:hypothetical protein
VRCSHDVTRMLQGWRHKVVTVLSSISWLYRTCWSHLATSLIISTSLIVTIFNKLFYTCLDNLEQAVRTQLVGGLLQDASIGDRTYGLNLLLFESTKPHFGFINTFHKTGFASPVLLFYYRMKCIISMLPNLPFWMTQKR